MKNILEFQFEAMGTILDIKIWDQITPLVQDKIKFEILNFTDYFDNTYSRFKENSLVTKISKKKGVYEIEKDFLEILNTYKFFNEVTQGSINPLIGQAISDLGYDPGYTLQKKEKIAKTPDFLETLEILPPDRVRGLIKLNQEVLIDIGAIGKGYWVDKICEILKKNNCKKFLVNGSGDIFFNNKLDDEKINVKLSPGPSPEFQNVTLYNQALCGSGTNIRNWSVKNGDNLHHIIDAKTNLPTDNIIASWVKVGLGHLPTTYADGLTSALFFLDYENIKKNLNSLGNEIYFEYLTINKDGLVKTNLEF